MTFCSLFLTKYYHVLGCRKVVSYETETTDFQNENPTFHALLSKFQRLLQFAPLKNSYALKRQP